MYGIICTPIHVKFTMKNEVFDAWKVRHITLCTTRALYGEIRNARRMKCMVFLLCNSLEMNGQIRDMWHLVYGEPLECTVRYVIYDV